MTPLESVTLSRLRLLASVINARLVSFVAELMKREISQAVLWADSTIALCWIKGPSYKWKPFVANRVEEIESKFSPGHWRYCPGKENTADLSNSWPNLQRSSCNREVVNRSILVKLTLKGISK